MDLNKNVKICRLLKKIIEKKHKRSFEEVSSDYLKKKQLCSEVKKKAEKK